MKKIIIDGRTYQISADGRVFNSYGKELHKHLRDGYEYVAIATDGKRKKYSVHRLVAISHLPNPNNAEVVNHINGIRNDNRVENLEWCSQSYNQMHSRYVLNNQTGFKDRPVRCIETNQEYASTRDAWRKTNISYSHISECASGKRKTAGGMRWEYAALW